jgi:hypothetical protein
MEWVTNSIVASLLGTDEVLHNLRNPHKADIITADDLPVSQRHLKFVTRLSPSLELNSHRWLEAVRSNDKHLRGPKSDSCAC